LDRYTAQIMIYFTDAIVLKRTDAGEADLRVTLYTKEFGKIRALAQGVKREGAKLRGHLEQLSLVHVGFVSARQGERLVHASLIRPWSGLQRELPVMGTALRITDFLDRHSFDRDRDDAVWAALIGACEALDEGRVSSGECDTFRMKWEERLDEWFRSGSA